MRVQPQAILKAGSYSSESTKPAVDFMQIILNVPHAFFTDSSSVDNAYALRALLDCLIDLNLGYLRTHSVPSLYKSGVRYGRTTWWEPIPALYARGKGDCKSLTAALIAQYRLTGVEARPVFRWITKEGGGTDYHILVQTLSGFEDPSKVLGMGKNENMKFTESDGTVMAWDGGTTQPRRLGA